METWSQWRLTVGTWFLRALTHLRGEHVALLLMLALLVYAELGRAEGEQVAGPPSEPCPMGQDRVVISFGPIVFSGCLSAAERERASPRVFVNGQRIEPPLRVLIVRGR